MTDNLYVRKKSLLEEMKLETLQQLRDLEAEDTISFLERVERCEKIISIMQELEHTRPEFSPEQTETFRQMLQEIMGYRQQIDRLIPPLYQKLKKQAVIQKQQTTIKQGYADQDSYLPSIFFDKKN